MDNEYLSKMLASLSPAKRLKYIRQKLLQQNQHSFCEDGLIREGTLKSIEIERMKIGPKIAERLTHKLSLEGIICEPGLFLESNNPCMIHIDASKKDLAGGSKSCLEEMRQKITQLIPITIETDEYAPLIPAQSTLLAREADSAALKRLNKTLCFIQGSKTILYYLSYLNDQELLAEMNHQKQILSANIIDFCSIFIVELIYFNF